MSCTADSFRFIPRSRSHLLVRSAFTTDALWADALLENWVRYSHGECDEGPQQVQSTARVLIDYMTEPPAHPALIRVARVAAAISGSDWRPAKGDVLLPIESSGPLFAYEHRFGPGEVELEAGAAGLSVAARCDVPHAPLIVLQAASLDR